MDEARGPDPVTGALVRIQALLMSVPAIEDFLLDLARLAAEVVDESAACGVTVRQQGSPFTVVSTDARARQLDETQYATQDGPCLEAFATGRAVLVRDLADEPRWPAHTARARDLGVRSSYSLPMVVNSTSIGALNLYAFHRADAFDAVLQNSCALVAAQAAGALHLATRNARNAEVLAQLETALSSRTVIDQAIGILIGRYRCTADEAFTRLRVRSQNSQRKLREVAEELVRNASGRTPEPGKPFNRPS